MPDNMVALVKRAAVEAVESAKPVHVVFGTVVSDSPLEINVEQKMTLKEKQLVLTRSVTDYTVEMTVGHETETALGLHVHAYEENTKAGGADNHTHPYDGVTASVDLTHMHEYKGKKEFLVHNALRVGERVVLLRLQGGQKFLVLDRLGGLL